MKCAMLLLVGAATVLVTAVYAFTDEVIMGVNNGRHTWQAEHNHITRRGLRGIKKLLGTRLDKQVTDLPLQGPHLFGGSIYLPSSFDARNKWPQCPTIRAIRDQSNCGSCWAVATAATMSDRLCISTGFTQIRNVSAHHILSCCTTCGQGCNGGYTTEAVKFIYYQGVVSGSEYGSNEGCQPYQIAPCAPCTSTPSTPACSTSCLNPGYPVTYNLDKKYLRTGYSVYQNEIYIMSDIFVNGPVIGSYVVYNDFPAYKSGVYQRTSGSSAIGGHSIKIMGWGVENGVKYWLVANTWGRNWGDNGTFKIRRGTNECRIEEFIIGGKF